MFCGITEKSIFLLCVLGEAVMNAIKTASAAVTVMIPGLTDEV